MSKQNHYAPRFNKIRAGTIIIDHFGTPFMVVADSNGNDGDNNEAINLNAGLFANRYEIACPWIVEKRGNVTLTDDIEQ